jgi:hypothetical protein
MVTVKGGYTAPSEKAQEPVTSFASITSAASTPSTLMKTTSSGLGAMSEEQAI